MNQKDKWKRINESLRHIRASNKSGSHRGCVRFNTHNSEEHEMKKAEVALGLLRNGHEILTEAILEGNLGIIDVLDLCCQKAYEIVVTEGLTSIEAKANKYPFIISVVRVEKKGLKRQNGI